ncbi:MAG: hypothetical protein ACNA8K_13170 [Cyclonatronaceae bacterium]
MFIQSPARARTTKPNLRQVDPSAKGGSLDSFFRGRVNNGQSNGWKTNTSTTGRTGSIITRNANRTGNSIIGSRNGNATAAGETITAKSNGNGISNRRRISKGNGQGTGNENGRVQGVKPNRRKKPAAESTSTRKGPKAGRLILWTLILGVLGYGYITHVFATQQLNSEVNELRRQFENVQANHASKALTYDRMTGPAEVYRRARELGFIDPGPADHVIIID